MAGVDNLIEETVLSQYVPGFTANLNMAPQQTMTKLLGAVDGDIAYATPGELFNADDVQPSDPVDSNQRVPDTPDKFQSFTRRVGAFFGYSDSAWFPDKDKVRELEDPTSKGMQSLMAGRWRKVDTAILANAIGNAMSKDDNGATFTSHGLPAAQIIAATSIAYAHDAEILPGDGSAYGMSVAKMLNARRLLKKSELEGEMYIAMTPDQVTNLLQRTPATSKYYNQVSALNDGTLSRFLGMNIIEVASANVIPSSVAGGVTTRQCVAWIAPAIVYRARPIINARIGLRADKSYRAQAFYENEHGAVRRYDKGVVRIDCKE